MAEQETGRAELRQLRSAAQLDPRDLAVLRRGLELSMTIGSAEETLRWAIDLAVVAPEVADHWRWLGEAREAVEDWAGAELAYARLCELEPEAYEPFAARIRVLIQAGKRHRALAWLKRLPRASAEGAAFHMAKGGLLADLGELHAAIVEVRRATEFEPNVAAHWGALGSLHHFAGDPKAARLAYDRALALAPEDPSLWNSRGYSAFAGGALEDALADFDRALALDPSFWAAWYNRGYALHSANRFEEALANYQRCVGGGGGDEVAWNNYGNALYNMGRYTDSIPKFVESLHHQPDYEIAWNNIGNALDKLGRSADALPYHERALEIRPGFDYALYAKGAGLCQLGRVEEALEWLNRSLEANAENAEAWRAKAETLRTLGRLDEALEALERAVRLDPHFAGAWADRAALLESVGSPIDSEASLARVLSPPPSSIATDREALVDQAELLERLGRSEEALGVLRKLLGMGEPSAELLDAYLRLATAVGLSDLPPEVAQALERSEAPRLLIAHARYEERQGRPEAALARLEKAPLPPGLSSVRVERARLLLHAGHILETREVLRAPTPPDASEELRVQAAALFLEADSASEALALLKSRFSLAGDSEALRLMGIAHTRLGNFSEARRALDRAVGLAPHRPEPWIALAELAERMGDPPGALRACDTALRCDPDAVEAAERGLRIARAMGQAALIDQWRRRQPRGLQGRDESPLR